MLKILILAEGGGDMGFFLQTTNCGGSAAVVYLEGGLIFIIIHKSLYEPQARIAFPFSGTELLFKESP